MIKKLVTVALAICYTSVSAQEVTSAHPISRTIFKLSPFHFTQNTLKIGIEQFNSSRTNSISGYVGVRTNPNPKFDTYANEGFDGVLGELQFKKYVSPIKEYISKRNKTVVQGVYAGVFVQGGSYSGNRTYQESVFDPATQTYTDTTYDFTEKIWNAGLGFTLGAQQVFWNAIIVDLYVGGGLQLADSSISGTNPPPSYYRYTTAFDPSHRGIMPKIGIQIGIGL